MRLGLSLFPPVLWQVTYFTVVEDAPIDVLLDSGLPSGRISVLDGSASAASSTQISNFLHLVLVRVKCIIIHI